MPAKIFLAKINSADVGIDGATYLARIEQAAGDVDYMIAPIDAQPPAIFTVEMIGRVTGIYRRE